QFWSNTFTDSYVKLPKTDPALKELKVLEDLASFHAQYKGRIYGNTDPDPKPKFFSGENFNKYGNFATEVYDKIVEIVYSDTAYDQIDEEWAAWTKTKMSQVQSVLDELNAGM
ncbi:MAG: hypothetical protein HN368_06350, partial [Spirochaetales bacterium]|nr:hypothetical protein [Spirochaetales bacterium]